MNLDHGLTCFVYFFCLIMKMSSAFTEIDVSDISLAEASCDSRSQNSEPFTPGCLGLYDFQNILLDTSIESLRKFIVYLVLNRPFSVLLERFTGKPEIEAFEFHRRVWFKDGDESLFNKVFRRNTRQFGPDLHSGFISSFYEKFPFNRDTTVESDNCKDRTHCVKAICRGEETKNSLITYIGDVNPAFEYTVFTAAICSLKGPITLYQVTFSLKSVLGDGIYVTVIYKEDAKEYSPFNVETVFFSLEKNGYIGIDHICDHFFSESWITLPGLQPSNYECGVYTSDSLTYWSCAGQKLFNQLLTKPDSVELQENFLVTLKEQDIYLSKFESILGKDFETKFKTLWFGEPSLFKRVYNPYGDVTVSGYLSFLNWAEENEMSPIKVKLGSQECDKRQLGYMEIQISTDQNINFFHQGNSLFDMVLFTEAIVRAETLGRRKDFRTPNPRDPKCHLTIRAVGGTDRSVMYAD